jgi:hypothetical protein
MCTRQRRKTVMSLSHSLIFSSLLLSSLFQSNSFQARFCTLTKHTHTSLSLSVYVSTTAWYWGADHSPPWVVSYDTIKTFVLLVLLLQQSKPTFQYWLLLLVSVGVWISSTCRVRHFHEVTKESIIWWQLTLRI